jgi:hypothetical protein
MGNGYYVRSKSPSKQGCVDVTGAAHHSEYRVYTELYLCIQSVYTEWYAVQVTSTHLCSDGDLLHT